MLVARSLRIGLAAGVAAILALAAAPTQAQMFPLFTNQLIRCTDTNFETNFGAYYTGSAECEHELAVCGGDPLDTGSIHVFPGGRIHARTQMANPWNMYEVYWHPLAGDPTDASVTIMVGNFLTDGSGNADADLVDITAPDDATTGTPVDFRARVGGIALGHFLVFSRGPYGTDSDGDGMLSSGEYNTSDGTSAGSVHNPVVNLECGYVQFVSGLRFGGMRHP